MVATQFDVSCCQRCRHFTFEGRRGGHCDQLNVLVQGRWSACSLANPVFVEPISRVTTPEVSHSVAVWPEKLVLKHRRLNMVEDIAVSEPLVESA